MLKEREREKRASRDGRCGEKNRCVVSLLRCVSVEEEKEREREREMQNRPLSIGWKKIDLSSLLSSLSLLLIFAPSFLPCFLPSCLLSLALLWGRERERVLLFGSFRFENERTVMI